MPRTNLVSKGDQMRILGPRSAGGGETGSGAPERRSRVGRNVTAVVGTCLLVGSLTTVAANASGASTKVSRGLSGTLTMNVFTFTTPVLQPVIAAFKKLNPGVTIKAANVVNTPDTYVPLLQTERLAGNEPDIDETYDVLTPTLEVDGLIADLSPDLKAGRALPAELLVPDLPGVLHPAEGRTVRCGPSLRPPERGRRDGHHVQRERVQGGRRAVPEERLDLEPDAR